MCQLCLSIDAGYNNEVVVQCNWKLSCYAGLVVMCLDKTRNVRFQISKSTPKVSKVFQKSMNCLLVIKFSIGTNKLNRHSLLVNEVFNVCV